MLATTMLGVVPATGHATAGPWLVAALLLFPTLPRRMESSGSVGRRHAARSGKGTPPPWDWDSVCIPVAVALLCRSLLMAETVVRNTGAKEVRRQ